MKQDDLYQNLKQLAEKFNISVTEHNFKNTAFPIRSGMCTVKGRRHVLLDKHMPLFKKNKMLASCLKLMPLDTLYVAPVVREFLEKTSADEGDI